MKYLNNEKGISLIKLLIIVAIIIVLIIIIASNSKPGYELSVENKEAVAYTSLRYAIAEGKVKGSSTLSSQYIDILGKMVKNADSNNQWFANNNGVFYGGSADNSDYEICWISDGTYCATFMVKKEPTKYYLCDYHFSVQNVDGCTIFVEK